MEQAIVIGSFGFLGYHLTTKLLEQGITVYGIDLALDEVTEIEEKIMTIGRNSNLHVLSKEQWKNLERHLPKKVDTLFYCIDLHEKKLTDLIELRENFIQAIEYCQNYVIKLILASSIELVGHDEPLITEAAPVIPLTKKGERYVELEELIKTCSTKKSFPYLILRFPTLYGPWQPETYAFQKAFRLKEEGMEGEWIEDEYMGDILYVEDAADALIKAALSRYDQEIVHITSDKVGEWEKGMSMIINQNRETKTINYQLSNQKARELLSFTPTISLEEGLRKQRKHNQLRLGKDL